MSLRSDTYKLRGEIYRRLDKRRALNLIEKGYPFFLVGCRVKPLDFHSGNNQATPVTRLGDGYETTEEVEKNKSSLEALLPSKCGKYMVYYVNAPLDEATYVK